MEINFYKLNFSGNDLILIDYLKMFPLDELTMAQISVAMCKRHGGIGGASTMFLVPGDETKVAVCCFKSNGDKLQNVDDNLICLGRYGFDTGLTEKNGFEVETSAGIRKIENIDSNNFRINLGLSKTITGEILLETAEGEYVQEITLDKKNYPVTPLFIRRPGGVLFFREESREVLKKISRELYTNNGISPELQIIFAKVFSRDEISISCWFYDKEYNYCAAASMAAAASVVNGFCDREMFVHINGQSSFIQWQDLSNEVLFTGSAQYIFTGTFYYEDSIE